MYSLNDVKKLGQNTPDPTQFPYFIQYGMDYFSPSQIIKITIDQNGPPWEVHIYFTGDRGLQYSFYTQSDAQNFVEAILFGNIVTVVIPVVNK